MRLLRKEKKTVYLFHYPIKECRDIKFCCVLSCRTSTLFVSVRTGFSFHFRREAVLNVNRQLR